MGKYGSFITVNGIIEAVPFYIGHLFPIRIVHLEGETSTGSRCQYREMPDDWDYTDTELQRYYKTVE